jgi:hypothetical protein
MAMLVVVLMTLLVVGAIAFTGHERTASVLHTRSEALDACAQAARELFLSRVRVLQANVGQIVLDTQLGTKMRVQTRHYDGTVALDTVTPVPGNRVAGASGLEQDLSNRVGRSPLLAGYYQVTALCQEGSGGPEQEIEFLARVGL